MVYRSAQRTKSKRPSRTETYEEELPVVDDYEEDDEEEYADYEQDKPDTAPIVRTPVRRIRRDRPSQVSRID